MAPQTVGVERTVVVERLQTVEVVVVAQETVIVLQTVIAHEPGGWVTATPPPPPPTPGMSDTPTRPPPPTKTAPPTRQPTRTPVPATLEPSATNTPYVAPVKYLLLVGHIRNGMKVYYGRGAVKAYGFEILGIAKGCGKPTIAVLVTEAIAAKEGA